MLVCLGDLTLDVVVRLRGELARDGDTDAEIVLGAGGQAANVAAWASSLGARVRFVGKTGADAAGDLARMRLAAHGVEVLGPVEGRNGAICAFVSHGGARSMAADRGAAPGLRVDELEAAWFEGCSELYVSGYALTDEPVRSAAVRAAALAREVNARVGVGLASWSAIRDTGLEDFREAALALRPDVVFANEDEERLVGRDAVAADWIVTRGERGCSFVGNEWPALAVERVVDTTGAGDALAAGWLVGGPSRGLEAAARCIGQLGGMPVASGP